MFDDISTTLELPNDEDGYCLLKCDHCNELFKLMPEDFQSDAVLDIYCPSCGLKIKDFLTDEARKLAEIKVNNIVSELIAKQFGKLAKKNSSGPLKITVKVDKDYESEIPLKSFVNSLELIKYPCCQQRAKISPLLIATNACCPFCGVNILNIDKPELQKIIYRFRSAASRFMKADYEDYYNEIVKFLNYLDGENMISEYIINCGDCELNWNHETERINSDRNALFPLGTTKEEEVRNIVSALRYVVEEGKSPFVIIPESFAMRSSKYQNMVKDFNDRVIYHLIEHINDYLTECSIDAGLDNSANVNVLGNNNNVNIATNNSVITNNNIDVEKLLNIIERIKEETRASELSDEEKHSLTDSVEVIEEQVNIGGTWNKGCTLAVKTINSIKVVGELASAVKSLWELVGPFVN